MPVLLPVELFEACIKKVDRNDKATLSAVCASSKLGQQVATPLLYNTINATHLGGQGQYRLRSLCQTVASNRTISKLVRVFKHFNTSILNLPISGRHVCPVLQAALRDHKWTPEEGNRNGYDFVKDFENQWHVTADPGSFIYQDNYAAIVLLLCPNVQTVYLSGHLRNTRNDRPRGPTDASILGLARCNLPALSNISFVRLNGDGQTTRRSRHPLLQSVLRLPSLHTLHLHGLVVAAEAGLSSSTVKHVDIKYCHDGGEALSTLIKAIPEVRTFGVEVYYPSDYHSYDWAPICDALQSCSHLERLCFIDGSTLSPDRRNNNGMDYEMWCDWTEGPFHRIGPRQPQSYMGDLRSVSSLEHLTIPAKSFGDGPDFENILPDSLRKLVLVYDGRVEGSTLPGLLEIPRLAGLDDLTVVDWEKKHLFSSKHGERGISHAEREKEKVWMKHFTNERGDYVRNEARLQKYVCLI